MISFARGVPGLFVWTINLRNECLQHRRTRRHLGHRHPGTKPGGYGCHARADAFGDVVALGLAFTFWKEVHLNIGYIRAPPHEVMAYQAVEVERCRHPA
jgi:hypothetical protein